MNDKNINNNQISYKPFLLIALAAITALTIILISYSQGYRMTAKYSGLIDASMKIKLEATYAHLWFEERMSGDEKESIEKVNAHLERSMWFSNAMLNGGANDQSVYIALEEASLRKLVEEVQVELEKLKLLTAERYDNFVHARPGSELDDQYDATFVHFIELADIVENVLKSLILDELDDFKSTHYLMALSVLIIAIGMCVVSWRHEQQHLDYMIDMREAQDKLEELSKTDQLTGLANRRAFDETLLSEFNRAMRAETPLALIMLDVDFFKNFNDSYGHLKGDNCLENVANAIKNLCKRSLDVVTRYGGEEFAVILPNSEQTQQLANSMREAVEALLIPHESSEVSRVVTISIGVAEIVPIPSMNPDDLVGLADKALYQAKNGGRNQVVTLDLNENVKSQVE